MTRSAMLSILIFILCLLNTAGYSWDGDAPLIVDHTQTDLSAIPAYRIDAVQSNIKLHYAHTSHGGQLTYGLSRIEAVNSLFAYSLLLSELPEIEGELCIFDGQEPDIYITPDEYWQTPEGLNLTRNVLDNNPSINVSMWCWCTQLYTYTEAQVQEYLDAISLLQTEYPNVTFVYMTGTAEATGAYGLNTYLRNELIRQYCHDNNKVLYDFADLDCWWFNPDTQEWECTTYEYGGYTIPAQHPQFVGSEAYHTTVESCEQKGRALWWLLTRIDGGAAGDTLAVYEKSWSEIKDLYK